MRRAVLLAVLALAACAPRPLVTTLPPNPPPPRPVPAPISPSPLADGPWREFHNENAALARAAGCGAIQVTRIDALLADLAADRRHAGIPSALRRLVGREGAEYGVRTSPRTCTAPIINEAREVLDRMIAALPPARRPTAVPLMPAQPDRTAPTDTGWQPGQPAPRPPPPKPDQLDL